MRILALVVGAFVTFLVACTAADSIELVAPDSETLITAESVYRTERQLCLRAYGFEIPPEASPTVTESQDPDTSYALGASTRHFAQSILGNGLLGVRQPAPIATNPPLADMPPVEELALARAIADCEEQAGAAALLVIGSVSEEKLQFTVGELEAKLAADPEILAYEARAKRCMTETFGARFSTPEEAIAYFENLVEAIGPSSALELSSTQMDALSRLQRSEFEAVEQLETCGWGPEHRDLLQDVGTRLASESE